MGRNSQFVVRDYLPGEFVHFTVRSVDRHAIFLGQSDHDEFQWDIRSRLDKYSGDIGPQLHAFGQMANHQHVLMRVGLDPALPSKIMHGACTSHAMSYNRRHASAGKVFQRPFRGRRITTADHLVNALVYIHLNPDLTLRQTNSSHPVFAGELYDPHIDPTACLSVFGGRSRYLEFMADTERLRAARRAARIRFGQ